MGGGEGAKARRRYVRFTRWRRGHFFRVLGETGHVRMAAAAAGVSLACIYRLRRVEAGFSAKMAAAVAAADARLRGGSGGAGGDAPSGTGMECPSPAGAGDDRAEALVVRRGVGGRLRVMAAGKRCWSARHDAIFLAELERTGNVRASARAAGFTAKSAWNRRERLSVFSDAWDLAMEAAEIALEFRLAAESLGLAGPEDAPFDREQALRTLTRQENKRRGYHSAGPKGAAAARMKERVVRKIVAVARYRARFGGGGAGGGSS